MRDLVSLRVKEQLAKFSYAERCFASSRHFAIVFPVVGEQHFKDRFGFYI